MASQKQQFWSDYIDGLKSTRSASWKGEGVEEHRPAKIASRTTISKTAPKIPQTVLFDAQALVRQSALGNIQATMRLATIKQQLSQRAAVGDVQSAMLLQKIQRLEISPIQPSPMQRQFYMPSDMSPEMPQDMPQDMPSDEGTRSVSGWSKYNKSEISEGTTIGEEERELARYGGASERASLARRTNFAGEFVRESDLQDDDEDEKTSSVKPSSSVRKNLKGGQESLKSTSRTISQAQTARSQAKDVAAAATWAAKLIHR